MTPNLFLATQKVFSPHKWFRAHKTERSTRLTEFWSTPESGQYEYIPGRGWFLVATLVKTDIIATKSSNLDAYIPTTILPQQEFIKLSKPIPVHRSRVLGRYLLEPDYKDRKRTAEIKNEKGRRMQAGFFRLDNGVAYVHCWDENGVFIPGGETGYKLWCIDPATQQFRHMKKGDDPTYIRSRQSSFEYQVGDAERISQESVSTAFHNDPGSNRDGLSVPSSRASSIRGAYSNVTSPASSRAQSRRGSFRRNNSMPIEEAKAALRRMAKEQQEAVAAAAAARTRTKSADVIHQLERGRLMERVAN